MYPDPITLFSYHNFLLEPPIAMFLPFDTISLIVNIWVKRNHSGYMPSVTECDEVVYRSDRGNYSILSLISPIIALGTGRSSIVFNPGEALIICGIMFTHIAMVPMPPGTSGLIERFISGVPFIVT